MSPALQPSRIQRLSIEERPGPPRPRPTGPDLPIAHLGLVPSRCTKASGPSLLAARYPEIWFG
jgi:hypothetical protein